MVKDNVEKERQSWAGAIDTKAQAQQAQKEICGNVPG